MKYLKEFELHSDYESYIEDNPDLPNVSICDDQPTHVHFTDIPPVLINFKIAGENVEGTLPSVTFMCEQGMTWAQWCVSKYKDSRVYISGNYVHAIDVDEGGSVTYPGSGTSVFVLPSDVIQAIDNYNINH